MLFTGAIVDRYGWTPVFFGAGVLPLLAMASVFFVLRRIEPAKFDIGPDDGRQMTEGR